MKEVYDSYKVSPDEGDFYKLVEADARDVDLQLTETEISSMKEKAFKAKVKSKVRNAALKNLIEQKVSHSKMDNIEYGKLLLQEYLKSPLFDSESCRMLMALRTRTVRGIKSDFRGMFLDCPLGCGSLTEKLNMRIFIALMLHRISKINPKYMS